jgi:hypothetical protein
MFIQDRVGTFSRDLNREITRTLNLYISQYE